MNGKHRPTFSLILLWALAACSTAPKLDTSAVSSTVVPLETSRQSSNVTGKTVQWGGQIIAIRNLTDSTELTVLAYPLDGSGNPRLHKDPVGRFIAVQTGFLEPQDYAPGRRLSLVGTLQATRSGKVGDSSYEYPILKVQQHYLWPRLEPSRVQPAFSIGVGFGF